MTNNFPYLVAMRTLALLDERKARLHPEQTSFYVWQRPDRVVVIFDTNMIDIGKVNTDFAHRLSTRLQGRLVVRTNSRGLFLQIGHEIPPAMSELTATPLDQTKQPTPYHIPVGVTASGRDMWLSLIDADSVLVGGSRGLGKTGFIHGVIQALLHGGSVEVYAYDGKGGVEFARYMGHPKFHLATRLMDTLGELKAIAKERRKILLASGHPNMLMHNRAVDTPQMMPIALIVDEAALTTEDEKAGLVDIVERERATGFYPILATNRPEQSALLVKSNLVTRISFPVPSWNASQMVLGQNGAFNLPKIRGRGLIIHQARVTEFQAFEIDFPAPSEETIRMVLTQHDAQPDEPTPTNEIAVMAESIRGKWEPTLSKRGVGRLLGKPYGGYWQPKIDKIVEYLAATTATATPTIDKNSPENGVFEPVAQ